MHLQFFNIIISFFLTLSLIGCADAKIKLEPSFWENKSTKIVIGITPFPLAGHTYKVVERNAFYGFLWIPLHSSMSEAEDFMDQTLTNFVRNFDYSSFMEIKPVFANEFTKRGMKASLLDDAIFQSKFDSLLITQLNQYSVASIRQATNADYLVLFKVQNCGLSGVYRAFSTPYNLSAVFSVESYLIDLHNREDKWKYRQLSAIFIQKEWNEPPDYPYIANAIRESIKKTIKELNASFFE